MVSVLKYTDKPQFVAMVADCIHLLCHRNPEKKLAVAACSGPAHLVKLLQVTLAINTRYYSECEALANKNCLNIEQEYLN